jgi:hypothetical protein
MNQLARTSISGVHPKRRFSEEPHDETSQKTALFMTKIDHGNNNKCRLVDLVRTNVSEERIAFFINMTRIG